MQNKKDGLAGVAALIIVSKTEILKAWMLEPHVVRIFSHYHISRNKFKPLFASKIVDYFIAILEGSQKIAACPEMNKFIDYMYEKEMHIKEVFQICMAFRRCTFRQLSSDSDIFSQDSGLLERISEIFDENLSSVLDYFSLLHLNREIRTPYEEDTGTDAKQLKNILNLQDDMILTVKKSHITMANRSFFQTMGVDDIEGFRIKYPDSWGFIETANAFTDIFKKGDYPLWLAKVADSQEQAVTITFVNQTLQKSKFFRAKIMRIPDKDKHTFTLTISALSDCDKKIEELAHYVYTDPLTNLYNRRKFDESVHNLVEQYHNTELPFSLIIIDLNDLNHINQMYGRELGDTILKEVSREIDKKFGSLGMFARIDGDRFGLVLKGTNLQEADTIAEKILFFTRTLTIGKNIEPKCNFAVLHCQKHDTQTTLLERADTLIRDIIKTQSDTIKNDYALIKEEKERRKQEAGFLIHCIELKSANKPLDIVSYYHEIPIQSKSKVLQVQKGVVTLTVRRISINALSKGSYLYIRTSEGKKDIKALVTAIDDHDYTVSIQNFNFVRSSPLDRKSVHVQVENGLFCFVKMDDTQIKGTVESISVDTLTLSLCHVYGIDKHNAILVDTTLHLEGHDEHLQLTGKIIKIIDMDDAFKLIISINKTPDIDRVIVPYVASKQLEAVKLLQQSNK